MPRTRPPERREVDEGEEGEADEVEAAKAAKKNGTATKGGKSKDREPAAADDGDEE